MFLVILSWQTHLLGPEVPIIVLFVGQRGAIFVRIRYYLAPN